MQHIIFAMLKILKFCKFIYTYIATKIQKVIFVKFWIILQGFLDNKIISENAIGSSGIQNCCANRLHQLAANTIRMGLDFMLCWFWNIDRLVCWK
jgi:hypothetical protein